jgi:hypothetical protein
LERSAARRIDRKQSRKACPRQILQAIQAILKTAIRKTASRNKTSREETTRRAQREECPHKKILR